MGENFSCLGLGKCLGSKEKKLDINASDRLKGSLGNITLIDSSSKPDAYEKVPTRNFASMYNSVSEKPKLPELNLKDVPCELRPYAIITVLMIYLDQLTIYLQQEK